MSKDRRLYVHLYVIPTCNLKCIHCYSDAMPMNAKVDRILSIDEMRQVITDLCDTYDSAFDVEGGEFFIRKDIDRLFEVVPPDYWRNITITTNGVAKINVDPELLRQVDEFRVSVEGHTDELQRSIRGINLRPVLKTCERLQSSGVPITLRITLHKKNYLQVREMLKHYLELGFTRFSLYEFQASGRGYNYASEYSLDQSDLEYVLLELCKEQIIEKGGLFKLSLSSRRITLVRSFQSLLESKGYEVIDLSGAASLTVNYNGVLGVCPWNVVSENVGLFHQDSFLSDVKNMMSAGTLDHSCSHCSAIRIRSS